MKITYFILFQLSMFQHAMFDDQRSSIIFLGFKTIHLGPIITARVAIPSFTGALPGAWQSCSPVPWNVPQMLR